MATASNASAKFETVGTESGVGADTTVTRKELELLPGTGSAVADVTVAVFVKVDPTRAPEGTATTNVKVTEAPEFMIGAVQDTVPLAPTAGVVQVNAGDPDCARETNVVPGGNGSVKVTLVAADGPLFVTMMV